MLVCNFTVISRKVNLTEVMTQTQLGLRFVRRVAQTPQIQKHSALGSIQGRGLPHCYTIIKNIKNQQEQKYLFCHKVTCNILTVLTIICDIKRCALMFILPPIDIRRLGFNSFYDARLQFLAEK